jgi:hypothetical protein
MLASSTLWMHTSTITVALRRRPLGRLLLPDRG